MICTLRMGLAGAGLPADAYAAGLPRSGLASTLPAASLLPPASMEATLPAPCRLYGPAKEAALGFREEGERKATTNGVGMERQPSSSSTTERPSTFYTSRRALRGFRKRPPTQTASGQNLFPPTRPWWSGLHSAFTAPAASRAPPAPHGDVVEAGSRGKRRGHCSQAPDGRTGGHADGVINRALRRIHCTCHATHGAALPLP